MSKTKNVGERGMWSYRSVCGSKASSPAVLTGINCSVACDHRKSPHPGTILCMGAMLVNILGCLGSQEPTWSRYLTEPHCVSHCSVPYTICIRFP